MPTEQDTSRYQRSKSRSCNGIQIHHRVNKHRETPIQTLPANTDILEMSDFTDEIDDILHELSAVDTSHKTNNESCIEEQKRATHTRLLELTDSACECNESRDSLKREVISLRQRHILDKHYLELMKKEKEILQHQVMEYTRNKDEEIEYLRLALRQNANSKIEKRNMWKRQIMHHCSNEDDDCDARGDNETVNANCKASVPSTPFILSIDNAEHYALVKQNFSTEVEKFSGEERRANEESKVKTIKREEKSYNTEREINEIVLREKLVITENAFDALLVMLDQIAADVSDNKSFPFDINAEHFDKNKIEVAIRADARTSKMTCISNDGILTLARYKQKLENASQKWNNTWKEFEENVANNIKAAIDKVTQHVIAENAKIYAMLETEYKKIMTLHEMVTEVNNKLQLKIERETNVQKEIERNKHFVSKLMQDLQREKMKNEKLLEKVKLLESVLEGVKMSNVIQKIIKREQENEKISIKFEEELTREMKRQMQQFQEMLSVNHKLHKRVTESHNPALLDAILQTIVKIDNVLNSLESECQLYHCADNNVNKEEYKIKTQEKTLSLLERNINIEWQRENNKEEQSAYCDNKKCNKQLEQEKNIKDVLDVLKLLLQQTHNISDVLTTHKTSEWKAGKKLEMEVTNEIKEIMEQIQSSITIWQAKQKANNKIVDTEILDELNKICVRCSL